MCNDEKNFEKFDESLCFDLRNFLTGDLFFACSTKILTILITLIVSMKNRLLRENSYFYRQRLNL